MNARTQFRRALGTTFAVHVLSTAVAAWAALELGGALVGAAMTALEDDRLALAGLNAP